MNTTVLEIRRIDKHLECALADFFNIIKQTGDDKYFHPHPFDKASARAIANYCEKDLYYAVLEDSHIIGYGMLRGWDAGYETPSLGILIHPEIRGMQLGKLLMHFLHAAARCRAAKKVRLKVYPDNTAAMKMYQDLGYMFQDKESGQLIGTLNL